MNPTAIIAYLKEFKTPVEIRTMWQEIGDALFSKASLPIVINQRSREGVSSAGISLSTNAEASLYMECCRAALVQLGETTESDTSATPATLDFSHTMVLA